MRYCLLEKEVNNIAIKLEQIHFYKDTIEKLNKVAKIWMMEVTYYYGYILEFDKVKVYAISPHKIILRKYGYDLLVLNYGEYNENNNLYLIPNEKEPFTICSIKRYIKEC